MTPVLPLPWDDDTVAAPPPPRPAKRRGRRPAVAPVGTAPQFPYHHLTVSGPAATVAAFAAAARGPGVIPWQFDPDAIEEDIFNLAASQPAERRSLTIAGCRILARQLCERVAARQARAAARIGRSRACPFDLQTLLPVPPAILSLGPTHPAALAWLAEHWGLRDPLRQVAVRPAAQAGRRLPRSHAVIGYGFFTTGATPHAAIAAIAARWPALRIVLQPRPAA